jgi:hypothetical protein
MYSPKLFTAQNKQELGSMRLAEKLDWKGLSCDGLDKLV